MRLIILNGPTGVGKSTVAAQLHKEMPDSVLVNVDELRRTIPGYQENRKESLRSAYDLTREEIERGFDEGKDVIIDKTIGDSDVLDTFITIAHKHGADIHEFILFTSKAHLRERTDKRGYKPGGFLTPEKVEEHWEQANTLRIQRPNVMVVDTTNKTPEGVLAEIKKKLGLI